MFGWATRFSMQFRILVLALAAGLITFGVVNVPHFWLSLTAFAAVLAIASRNAALLSARVDELWRESQQMSCAKAVMTADRDRMSPLLKSALITLLVLVPPAVLGGTVGQALMAPVLLMIARNLVTTTLVGLFVLPLLTLWFCPRTAPEEWSEVYESEVPVASVMPEKVEV